MRAKEYWVIMCSSLEPDTSEHLYAGFDYELKLHSKQEALNCLAELTATYPNTVYTLYHLVPTEHTTHKR